MTVKKKQAVFDYLHARLGQWVEGPELTSPAVGGGEGLRRLRENRQELRTEGWVIEGPRRIPGRNTRLYRLVEARVSSGTEGKGYWCPRSGCGQALTPPVESVDPNFGFGSCARHGVQMVKL